MEPATVQAVCCSLSFINAYWCPHVWEVEEQSSTSVLRNCEELPHFYKRQSSYIAPSLRKWPTLHWPLTEGVLDLCKKVETPQLFGPLLRAEYMTVYSVNSDMPITAFGGARRPWEPLQLLGLCDRLVMGIMLRSHDPARLLCPHHVSGHVGHPFFERECESPSLTCHCLVLFSCNLCAQTCDHDHMDGYWSRSVRERDGCMR